MIRIEPRSVHEVADLVGGRVVGDGGGVVSSIASLADAVVGSVSFFGSETFREDFRSTKATCILVNEAHGAAPPSAALIMVEQPYQSFIKILQTLVVSTQMPIGHRSASAVIASTAQVHETASIGPGCVVGDDCIIGEHVQLIANVVIGDRTHVGHHTAIHANASIYSRTHIGSGCIIHAGAVIGSDGFGYVEHPDGTYTKIPQVGNVIIGNDVEIGANTTIDRAAIGSTVIDDGVKIDNLVQIAHGVAIGEHSAIAAQAGVSGSTRIGRRVRLAGQVGVAGHIEITDHVIVMGQSGVTKSVSKQGVYSGTPAQEHIKQLRNDAAMRDIRSMQERLQALETIIKQLDSEE